MPDVSAKIKGLNVEFNDNLTTSPNIDSGDDIKTSFARIHKRFSDMKTGAYEDIADQYYPSGTGSEKLVTGEIVASALENVTTDIEQINYALTHLSEQFDAEVKTNITTGYYISGIQVGDNWTEHMNEDESSQYLEEALYLGARQINKNLKLTVADHRSTSIRCFGFCDENDIVTSYYKESWDIWEQNSDGTYTATMPIDAPYFFFSYSNLEVLGLEITEDLLNRTGYVSPDGSDDNGGSTIGFAFKTVNKALSSGCDRIILAGGKYFQQVNLGLATGNHLEFISYDRTTRPVFYDPDAILVESATLSSGIYSATIDQSISSNNWWLYQDNVGDVETQIAESERLPVQRGKNYRLEDTRIEKCYADNLSDALDEISESSICKWYLDGTTLYFTSPETPSSTNPICISTGKDLFSNANRSISVKMSGIKCKYISLNLKNLCNAEAIDCCATNVFGWGAITWDNTLNAYFLRCEASSCSNGTNGDGFNADVTNTGEAFSKHYTATLIDCWSHDNMDDGYSDHRHAETTIIGGLFEYNGKAGLTPAHGAHCSCYNVYSRKNYTGFMCAGDVEEAEGGKFTQMICYNCVAELNNRAGNETGFYVDGLNNRMTLISCKAIGNPTAYYVGETASIKLVDCTAFDNNRFLHGYPENATVENTGLYRYIPQSSDLNDFKGNINVGNYLCPTSRVTTILNKPTDITTAFKMDVYNYNDQTMQIIYPNDDLCLFYVRLYNGTAWSSWKESATAMQILSYGNSTWNDFITVYNKNAVVYCRASSNSNPATGSQTRMAFMAYVNNGTDPTEVEFQYYRSVSSHTDSQQGDQVYVYKLNKTSGWSVTTRNAFSKINVSAPITKSYASQQITLGHADSGVTAGTYNSVTVDAMGHVTGGSNPTTLSGYGITDANITNGTITLGSNTITPITSFSSLDSPSVGGSGKYISSISETDGIISATETTLDTVPTENSTNAITSGAVYTDSANQQLEIDYAINTGAKNLLKIREPFTNTRNNVTFVVNVDGTVDVSTTSEGASAQTDLTIGTVNTYEGVTYKLTGCPSGVTGRCACGTGGTGSVIDTGSGALLTPTADSSRSPFVRVYNGAVITTPVKFYPMIRLAEIKNDTFEPYAPTNRELYETKTEQTETNVIANLGAKNLLKITASSQTIKGVTFTVNDDQTVTVNGTNDGTGTSLFVIVPNAQAITIPDGNYILSGCPTGGGDNSFDLRWYMYSPGKSAYETGNGASIKKSGNGTGSNIAIVVKTGQTVNNLTFKPMVRPAEITDSSFKPYAPTNRELYETKIGIRDVFGEGRKITTNGTMDDLTLGNFYCSDSSDALTITNAPWTDSEYFGFCTIELEDYYLGDIFSQIAFKSDDKFRIAKRKYIEMFDTWTDWVYDYDVCDCGRLIPDQTNLNNMTTPGSYYGVNSTGETTINMPVPQGTFHIKLIVMQSSVNTYLQVFKQLSADGDSSFYIRRKSGASAWSSWQRFNSSSISFGTCQSTADSQIKAVTMTDLNWTRTVGGIIAVKFSNTNTFSATASDKIKLSVNGEEAEIYYSNAASPTGTNTACYGYANRYVYYIWDGTYWVWYSHGADNNTTYSSMSEAEIRAGTSTTARLITPARLNLAIRGLGTSLSSGTDLNTLLTSGAYYTSTAAIAKSCTHRPAYSNDGNTLFRLEVLYIASTSILMQKLYTIQTSGTEIRQIHEYYRGYQSSTWGSWRQVTDTTIADYTG